MTKYAIVKIGGKQIRLTEGKVFELDRQAKLNMEVLAYSDGKTLEVGTPTLADVIIKAAILKEKRSKKTTIGRFRAKSRHRRVVGHRQPLSVITIETIGKKSDKKEEPKAHVTGTKAVKKEAKTASKAEKKPTTKKVTKKKEVSN